MKRRLTIAGILFSIALLATLPMACGGGGGGGGDNGGGGGGSTTTTQQTLNQENVDNTMESFGNLLPVCAMNAAAPEATSTVRTFFDLSKEIVDQVEVVYSDGSAMASLVDQSPNSMPGSCSPNPGQVEPTFLIDEAAGLFEGGIDFQDFCSQFESEQVTIDGKGTFNGTFDLNVLEELQSATLKFSTTAGGIEITTAEGSANISITGFSLSINQNPDGTSGSITLALSNMTVVTTNSEGSQTFTLSGFTATATFSDTGATLNASGTVTESGVGSVSFNIASLSADTDGNVTGGLITISGADGTKITIRPLPGNDFIIEADTDGDGISEYEPGTMNCDENPLQGISFN